MKRTISVAAGCYNEIGNIRELYERCKAAIALCGDYDYEFVLADNASTDGTRELLRQIAAEDPKFRVILNSGNTGHIRSPYNAFLHATGDVVVWMCSDLQEPPETIVEFVKQWEAGYKIVAGVRTAVRSSVVMEMFRRLYYWMLGRFSREIDVIPRFTGFGLYDRVVVEAMRKFDDPYPYVRGLIAEIGFRRTTVGFVQDARKFGRTHNNFATLYDMAALGFVSSTKFPLRAAGFVGLFLTMGTTLAFISCAMFKLVGNLAIPYSILVGLGLAILCSLQLCFIGVIGEYLGAVLTIVRHRPLAIEEEMLNFS